jgi:hypothetical protein
MARFEQLAPKRQEPPLGSHLITPRRGYLHHGIYVGDGKVVHYAGLAGGLHRGPVEEVPLARFTRGRPVWLKSRVRAVYATIRLIAQPVNVLGRIGLRPGRAVTNATPTVHAEPQGGCPVMGCVLSQEF